MDPMELALWVRGRSTAPSGNSAEKSADRFSWRPLGEVLEPLELVLKVGLWQGLRPRGMATAEDWCEA